MLWLLLTFRLSIAFSRHHSTCRSYAFMPKHRSQYGHGSFCCDMLRFKAGFGVLALGIDVDIVVGLNSLRSKVGVLLRLSFLTGMA